MALLFDQRPVALAVRYMWEQFFLFLALLGCLLLVSRRLRANRSCHKEACACEETPSLTPLAGLKQGRK